MFLKGLKNPFENCLDCQYNSINLIKKNIETAASACYTPIHLCIFIGLKIANYETLESWQTLAVSKVDCFVLFPEFKRYFKNGHHMDEKSIFKKSAD